MQEVVKKENESFENLLRRFNRRVQQSGKLSKARKKQFFEKEMNRLQKRREALRKIQIRELRKNKILGKR